MFHNNHPIAPNQRNKTQCSVIKRKCIGKFWFLKNRENTHGTSISENFAKIKSPHTDESVLRGFYFDLPEGWSVKTKWSNPINSCCYADALFGLGLPELIRITSRKRHCPFLHSLPDFQRTLPSIVYLPIVVRTTDKRCSGTSLSSMLIFCK